MKKRPMKHSPYWPGAGTGKGLSIRVSIAALVKVLFKNPTDGNLMIALERTATIISEEGNTVVVVRAKPFGGAARILKARQLKKLIGDFRFDSERSYEEQDFRIQIHPDSWENVQVLCRELQNNKSEGIIELSPVRELSEEFYDSLHVRIGRGDYDLNSRGLKIDDSLMPTNNIHAPGVPTRRIYFLFEAVLKNRGIIDMILENSANFSDQELGKMARADEKNGGRGRANAVLALDLLKLEEFHHINPWTIPGTPLLYEGYQLDGNVQEILGPGP